MIATAYILVVQAQSVVQGAVDRVQEIVADGASAETDAHFMDPLLVDTVAEACVMSIIDEDVHSIQEVPQIRELSQRLRSNPLL